MIVRLWISVGVLKEERYIQMNGNAAATETGRNTMTSAQAATSRRSLLRNVESELVATVGAEAADLVPSSPIRSSLILASHISCLNSDLIHRP